MRPFAFLGRDGVKRFAWGPSTDPVEVTVELAWAWAPEGGRQSLCDWACPTTEGGYCLDCHGVAWTAAETARRKLAE